MAAIERSGDDLILRLRVQPRASRNELIHQGEQLRLRITAPPVDGKANAHLCSYLAGLFGVAKSRVEILSGESGRDKRVRIRQPVKIPAGLAQDL